MWARTKGSSSLATWRPKFRMHCRMPSAVSWVLLAHARPAAWSFNQVCTDSASRVVPSSGPKPAARASFPRYSFAINSACARRPAPPLPAVETRSARSRGQLRARNCRKQRRHSHTAVNKVRCTQQVCILRFASQAVVWLPGSQRLLCPLENAVPGANWPLHAC